VSRHAPYGRHGRAFFAGTALVGFGGFGARAPAGARGGHVDAKRARELHAALDAIEQEIAAMSGKPVRVTYVAASKGI